MTKPRAVSEPPPHEGRSAPDSPGASHPRVGVRAKAFVDFCEVPELGDVNDQRVLFVDDLPVLRGSPRRVSAVAASVVELMHASDAVGQNAEPLLRVLRADVGPLGQCVVSSRETPGALLHRLHVFGCPVVALRLDGVEHALDALPLPIGARGDLELTLANELDVEVETELVLCLDPSAATRTR
jgi:hypothetical protein